MSSIVVNGFCAIVWSMWVCVKRQLAVDSDIVEVWKIPLIFTNAEYADMMYVYGFCVGGATAAAAEEYRRRFPMRRIPDRRVLYNVFNTLRECGMCSCFIWMGT